MQVKHPPIPPTLWALIPFALGIFIADHLNIQSPLQGQQFGSLLALSCIVLPLLTLPIIVSSLKPFAYFLFPISLLLLGALRMWPMSVPEDITWTDEAATWEGLIQTLEGPDSTGECRAIILIPRPSGAKHANVKLTLPEGCYGFQAGGRLRFHGKIKNILPRNSPGERDRRPRARRKGLNGHSSANSVTWLPEGGSDKNQRMFQPLRERAWALIGDGTEPEVASILTALLTGDKSTLSVDTRNTFARSGLSHALAISGLHVAGVGFAIFGLFRFFLAQIIGIRRKQTLALASILALLASLSYALFANLPTSAIRAFMMMAIALAVARTGRKTSGLSTLALAGFLILLHDPASLFELGFQLSFVSVLALILLSPLLEIGLAALPKLGRHGRVLKGIRTYTKGSLIATFSATLGTAPYMCHFFFGLPLASPLANLLGLFLLASLSLPFGIAAIILDNAGLHTVGLHFLDVAALGVEGTLFIAKFFANWHALPFFNLAISQTTAIVWGMLTLTGLLACRKNWTGIPLGAVALALFAISTLPHFFDPPSLEVTQLPVGQGDGLFVTFPEGQTMVIDGGGLPKWGRGGWDPGQSVMVPALLAEGINHIDYMVLSHPDPDHLGGLLAIAKAIPVSTLWIANPTPGGFRERLGPGLVPRNSDDDLAILLDTVRKSGGKVQLMTAGDGLDLGDATIKILHPSADFDAFGAQKGKAANNGSLTLRIEAFGEAILLAGDLEAYGESHLLERDEPMKSIALKLPHHGSDTSSTPEFLDRVDPTFALVGVGKNNQFAFPKESVLKRLRERGITLCRTDEGACRVVFDAQGVRLFQWETPSGWHHMPGQPRKPAPIAQSQLDEVGLDGAG